jgi:hypothetical protein
MRLLFQAKEQASTNAAHVQMAVLAMDCALEYENYGMANTFATKTELLLSQGKNEPLQYRAKVCLALCELDRKRYKQCAKLLLQVCDANLGNMVSQADVAQIAVLCALATFSREEMKNLVNGTVQVKYYDKSELSFQPSSDVFEYMNKQEQLEFLTMDRVVQGRRHDVYSRMHFLKNVLAQLIEKKLPFGGTAGGAATAKSQQ